MPEEACAMVCGLLSAICTILSWYTMMEGDWESSVLPSNPRITRSTPFPFITLLFLYLHSVRI